MALTASTPVTVQMTRPIHLLRKNCTPIMGRQAAR
jgi:hypothetical protein